MNQSNPSDLDKRLMQCCIALDFKTTCQRIGIPANENITIEILNSKNESLTKITFETGPEISATPQYKNARPEIINFLNKCDANSNLFDVVPSNPTQKRGEEFSKETYTLNLSYGKLKSIDPMSANSPVPDNFALGDMSFRFIKVRPWPPRKCCVF